MKLAADVVVLLVGALLLLNLVVVGFMLHALARPRKTAADA